MKRSIFALGVLAVAALAGSAAGAQVYQSSFEGTDGGWVGNGDWERGVVMTFTDLDPPCDGTTVNPPAAAFDGTEAWGTNVDGCHQSPSSTETWTLSQTFDFSLVANPQLLFHNWQDSGGNTFDMCVVRVNGDEIFLGSGSTGGWVEESLDLSAYGGLSSVTIEFAFVSSTVVNRAGWYIDNVRIEGDVPGPGVNYILSIQASAPNATPNVASCNITYDVTVTNFGNDAATGTAAFSAPLPGNAMFDSGMGASLDMGNIVATIPALGAQAQHTFSFVLAPIADGTMSVNGNVTLASDSDTDLSNNSDSVDVAVSSALPNDNCCAATNLNMQVFPFSDFIDNSFAFDGPDAGDCGSSNVGRADFWYVFTAPADGSLIIDEGSTQDMVWGVYSACDAVAGLCLDDDDPQVIPLTMGQTVYVQLAAATDTTSISTNPTPVFDFATPPANDDCLSAVDITTLPFVDTVANLAATDGGDILGCESFGDVWYKWTSSVTGSIRASEGGGQSAEWGFYEGADCNSLSAIRCTTVNPEQHIDVFPGQTYWFRVGAGTATAARTTPLELAFDLFTPPPANDDCSAAQVLSTLPFVSGPLDNQAATASGDVSGCTNYSDIWYRWTATEDGTLLLAETAGQDAHWAVYEGSDCFSLFNLLCTTSDTNQSVPVFSGNVYTIRVGTGSVTSSTRDTPLEFTISFQGAITNDTCDTARNITSELPFSRVLSNADADSDGDIGGCDIQNDVWYTFTAPADGVLLYTETGTQAAEWGAYEGTDCLSLISLDCSATETNRSIPVTMGNTYKLRLGWDGTGTTTTTPQTALNFTISFFPAPSNDECAGATVLDIGLGGFEAVDARGAANDFDVDCNLSSATEALAGVWYTFTTGNDPLVLAIDETSTADIVKQFYTGSCGGLTPYECNANDSSNHGLAPNTTYYMLMSMSSGTARPTVPYNFSYSSFTAIANDICGGATVIDPNVFPQFYSADAALYTNDSSGCSTDQFRSGSWYRYTPTQANPLVITGPTSSPDTDFAVYQANNPGSPSCTDVTNIACGTVVPTVVPVTVGQTYYILLGDQSTSTTQLTGFYDFTFELGSPPPNDLCSGAIEVTSLPFNDLQPAAFASDDTPSSCAVNFFNGVWYRFTPSVSDDYLFSESSSINGVITVYSAPAVDPCNGLSEVACLASGTTSDSGFAFLNAGTTYYINVSRESTTVPSATLNWNFSIIANVEPLTNDFCVDAIEITDSPFSYTTDNDNATNDGPGGTCDAFVSGGPATMQNSIWFVLTPSTGGDLTVTVNGDIGSPTYDSIVTVLDAGIGGDPCTASLVEIACGDNPDPSNIPAVTLTAGNTYFILAGDNGSSSGGGLTLIDVSYTGDLGGGECPGDFNGDSAVDLADLIAFNTDWQPNIGTTQPAGTNGDYNGDTMVDLADLIAFNTDWQPNIGVPCP